MPRMAGMLDRTFPVGKGPDCLHPAQPNLKIKQLLQQLDSSRFSVLLGASLPPPPPDKSDATVKTLNW